jgi:2-methylcitrate dehydratase PrpD
VNGTASHAIDFDDVEMSFVGHPGVVVIPAALAVCEDRRLPWSSFDRAVAVGYQLAGLLGLATQPAHQERGWHTTSTLGTLAAAGAAAAAVRMDRQHLIRALGIAATQAGGVIGVFGSDAKAFQAGRAAASGVLSALLAESGLDAGPGVVTGPTGYLAASTGEWRRPAAPGPPLAVASPTVKVHATCRSTHCTIDAVHRIVADGMTPSRITALQVSVAPRSFQAAGLSAPITAYEARFSLRHAAALAALHPDLGNEVFVDGVWDAAPVLALRELVSVRTDPELARRNEPARVVAFDADGRRSEVLVESPVGSPEHPLPTGRLLEKFRRLLEAAPGGAERSSAVERTVLEREPTQPVRASALLPPA